MAGKSGSGQVFSSSKATTATQSNGNCAPRHKNHHHPFNHSSSSSYTSTHNKNHQAHQHIQNSHLRPHSPSSSSATAFSRINSSSSLSSSFNYNSPLASKASPSPSTTGVFSSPISSLNKINYEAPVACSMFYKQALKNRKNSNKKSSNLLRDNRNRDTSPVHPSALVSYLRGK